ncbi:hypothetical protein [Chryseobacterium taklimakanense]|uniref:hypothetical protein n=1 Tax=Chryseobacterium taklimakanense TaxID=536441 RepID=UPI0013DE4AF6|nr:hypothetical protein [Chryseobacterium taklimakanense]
MDQKKETFLKVSCKSLKSFADKPIMLKKLPELAFNGLTSCVLRTRRKLSYYL